MTRYSRRLLDQYTPEQIEQARAIEARAREWARRGRARTAAAQRQEREDVDLRRHTLDVRMTPELLAAFDQLVAEAYPEDDAAGRRSRLIRAIVRDALGQYLKDEDACRRLTELRERRANESGAGASGGRKHRTEGSDAPGTRSKRIRFRISRDLRERLKAAVAATRDPESSAKLGSSGALVCELLRRECGLPSRDGGETLKRLEEWLPRRHYCGATPVSREEIEKAFRLQAAKSLREHNSDLHEDLTDRDLGGDSYRLLNEYVNRLTGDAMRLYDSKFARYRVHLPEAAAQREAKQTVIDSNVLMPPLWTAVYLAASAVGEPSDPDLLERFRWAAVRYLAPGVFLAFRMTPVSEAGPGDEAFPLLALYELDMARKADAVYRERLARFRHPRGMVHLQGPPSPEDKAWRAVVRLFLSPETWDPPVDLLRLVGPCYPPHLDVELLI